MQPVIEEKKPQVSHHSAVKMKEVIVGDVKAIRTCKGYILERRKLIVSCVFFFFSFSKILLIKHLIDSRLYGLLFSLYWPHDCTGSALAVAYC